MVPDAPQRRLAAILSADAVGYSRLMSADEVGTARQLDGARELIARHVDERGGRVVDAPGDNVLAEFASVVEAVAAAVAIQKELAERNAGLPEERRMHFRIGINLGDVLVEGERLVGDGVNMAARLEAMAEPGGVCLSGTAFDQVEGKLEIGIEDLGPRSVKNIARPVRVYRVRTGAEAVVSAPAGPAVPRWAAAIALVALLASAVATTWWVLSGSGAGEDPAIESLAVLPLANLSGDPDQDYFADGMTEALIASVAKIGALRVISRTSVMQYRGTTKTLPEIAEELDVDAVIEGSVMRAGERVRITTQLIRADSDTHLWAESYDRDVRDVLALQDEVARAIAREVRVALTPEQERRLTGARRVDPAAYEALLRGRQFWNQRSEDGFRNAIEQFERAIELDPEYPQAHAGLADAYAMYGFYGYVPGRDVYGKIREHAERAIVLDADHAEGHAALGTFELYYAWNTAAARAALERAIELNPSYSTSYQRLGFALVEQGLPGDGLASVRRGIELDPLSSINRLSESVVCIFMEDWDCAIRSARETLARDPDFFVGDLWLARALAGKGEHAEAIAEARKAFERSGASPQAVGTLGWVYAVAGKRAEAERVLAEELERREREYRPVLAAAAMILAGLDERERVLVLLEEAIADREPYAGIVEIDSAFKGLREDPRFLALLESRSRL